MFERATSGDRALMNPITAFSIDRINTLIWPR
jgi:hypothetical protein